MVTNLSFCKLRIKILALSTQYGKPTCMFPRQLRLLTTMTGGNLSTKLILFASTVSQTGELA